MSKVFSDIFARHGTDEDPAKADLLSKALDDACLRLAILLAACGRPLRHDLLPEISARVVTILEEITAASNEQATQSSPAPLSPEILEWARRQFSEEEVIAGLREIRETGGLELHDFVHELEQAAGSDD